MNTLNVEVKNVKTFTGHDGEGYNASLYINGNRVAEVVNLADGGELDIKPFGKVVEKDHGLDDSKKLTKNKKILREAREKARELPPIETSYGELDCHLGLLIREAVFDYLLMKDVKKEQKKAFVAFNSKTNVMKFFNFKKPLKKIAEAGYVDMLKKSLKKFKEDIGEDFEIKNTNLSSLGITS